jgi:hypothetical protein
MLCCLRIARSGRSVRRRWLGNHRGLSSRNWLDGRLGRSGERRRRANRLLEIHTWPRLCRIIVCGGGRRGHNRLQATPDIRDRRRACAGIRQGLIAANLFDHSLYQRSLFRTLARLACLLGPPRQNALQPADHGLVLVSLFDLERDHFIQLFDNRIQIAIPQTRVPHTQLRPDCPARCALPAPVHSGSPAPLALERVPQTARAGALSLQDDRSYLG